MDGHSHAGFLSHGKSRRAGMTRRDVLRGLAAGSTALAGVPSALGVWHRRRRRYRGAGACARSGGRCDPDHRRGSPLPGNPNRGRAGGRPGSEGLRRSDPTLARRKSRGEARSRSPSTSTIRRRSWSRSPAAPRRRSIRRTSWANGTKSWSWRPRSPVSPPTSPTRLPKTTSRRNSPTTVSPSGKQRRSRAGTTRCRTATTVVMASITGSTSSRRPDWRSRLSTGPGRICEISPRR